MQYGRRFIKNTAIELRRFLEKEGAIARKFGGYTRQDERHIWAETTDGRRATAMSTCSMAHLAISNV